MLAGLAVEQTAALEAQRRAAIGARRHAQHHRAADRRHLDPTAQHRLPERHRHLDMDVIVARLKEGVRLHPDLDIGVARRLALGARHALTLQPQGRAVARAFRHVDIERAAIG